MVQSRLTVTEQRPPSLDGCFLIDPLLSSDLPTRRRRRRRTHSPGYEFNAVARRLRRL